MSPHRAPALVLAVSAGLGLASWWLGPLVALLGAGGSVGVAVWLWTRPVAAQDRGAVYQAVLDQLGHGVAALDQRGAMLVYNPAAEQILGTMRELPIGRALAGEAIDTEDIHLSHPKTGRPMWLRVTGRPLALADQSGTVIVFHDVTERKEVEIALARSEARHRALMEAAPYGVAILDAARRLVEHNPALERLLGYPADVEVAVAELQLGASDESMTTRVEHDDGRVVDVEVSVVPIATRGAAPSLFAVVLHDLTDRVRAERMKDDFISTVSHELRTPLTSIIGSLRLVTGGAVGVLGPKALKMVQIAEDNSHRLLALVDDLLDLQRVAAGRLDFDLEPHDLIRIVSTACDANRGYVQGLGVTLQLDTPTQGVPVRADAGRLQQVLANLLSNAAKYSPSGEAVQVEVLSDPPRVRVSDRGPGIPESLQARIFERFSHGGPPANPGAKTGTGLGLAISRVITEHHGGTLAFETGPARGTTFTLTLPTPSTTDPPPHEAPETPPPA